MEDINNNSKGNNRLLLFSVLINLAIIVIVLAIVAGYFYLKPQPGYYAYPVNVGLNQNGSQSPRIFTGEEGKVVKVVQSSMPAVVSIVITKDVAVGDSFGDTFTLPMPFLNPPSTGGKTIRREVGGGSGFLASPDGLVITNEHVVDDPAANYSVYTNDGKKYKAKIIAKDSGLDVAVLKINGSGFPYLHFGDSRTVAIGETVIAIGNVFDQFRNSVSAGVVSGLGRSIVAGDLLGSSEVLEGVIQTDAAINPGNSGGPLLDTDGNVIGVNVALASGSQDVGFALPADVVQKALESVQKTGTIVRPYLGIRYLQVNDTVKQEYNLNVDYGVLVIAGTDGEPAVVPGSPAAKAGIKEDDVILEADGKKLDGIKNSLGVILRSKNVGDDVLLLVLHNGKQRAVTVKLDKFPNK